MRWEFMIWRKTVQSGNISEMSCNGRFWWMITVGYNGGYFCGFRFLASRRGDGDLKSHVTGCNGIDGTG